MKKWVLLAILLGGCATEQHYKEKVSSWVGHSTGELLSAWGPPSSTFQAPDGSLLYTYFSAGGTQATAYTNGLTGLTTATASQWSCKTTFTIVGDTVWAWRYEGNNCVSD